MVGMEYCRFWSFYAPLSFAGAFGPGWLVASTWQITIVAGILLTPFFAVDPLHKKLPMKELVMSGIILFGVVLMQVEHASSLGIRETILCVVPVLIRGVCVPTWKSKNDASM